MAKKARKSRPAPPEPSGDTAMSIKMTVNFRDWISRLADSERLTSVQVVEKALVEYAERRKFTEQAPRRTEGR
jgi:predicted transcriptional regulator